MKVFLPLNQEAKSLKDGSSLFGSRLLFYVYYVIIAAQKSHSIKSIQRPFQWRKFWVKRCSCWRCCYCLPPLSRHKDTRCYTRETARVSNKRKHTKNISVKFCREKCFSSYLCFNALAYYLTALLLNKCWFELWITVTPKGQWRWPHRLYHVLSSSTGILCSNPTRGTGLRLCFRPSFAVLWRQWHFDVTRLRPGIPTECLKRFHTFWSQFRTSTGQSAYNSWWLRKNHRGTTLLYAGWQTVYWHSTRRLIKFLCDEVLFGTFWPTYGQH